MEPVECKHSFWDTSKKNGRWQNLVYYIHTLLQGKNTSKKRKYFQVPMKVLALAVESTFDDHRKYLRFLGSFLHKIYFVNKDYDRKNKMSISRQDVALQEYRDFCHHHPC